MLLSKDDQPLPERRNFVQKTLNGRHYTCTCVFNGGVQLRIEDAAAAGQTFSTLMGDVVDMLTFPGAPILLSCARFRDHQGDQTIV